MREGIERRRFLATMAALPLGPARPAKAQTSKRRRRRSECFFGLHFDLHPDITDQALGRDLTEEMVEQFLAKVNPDYVQYDCKGHVGYLGYPSKVGTPAPGIVKDSLEIWRRVTARHGVALFIHFSGLWDSLAIQQHPDWACIRADGSRDPNATSTFGPYVDALMIPELEEAAQRYDLDGAWVDGECWAVKPDYSAPAARAFREATGIPGLPKGPGDPGWLEFLELNRRQFRKYVRHYVDELHRARPDFQIASNWLYSTFVPERPELPVDFISGDYLGNASISTARLEARYLAAINKPWDLMAWGFQGPSRSKIGFSHKPAVQLQQEAAVVLAQGGGFQVYYQPTRAGWLDGRHIQVMAKVAAFCRRRQALSHQSQTVPQIGVLFSTTSLYTTANRLFGGWGAAADPARGLVDALIENHYAVDVIPEWKLAEVAGTYPLVVLPDWPHVGAKVSEILRQHVRSGGKLLVAGSENAALVADELGVRLVGKPAEQDAFVTGDEEFTSVHGVWQQVELAGARGIEQRYPTEDSRRDAAVAATMHQAGAGEIAAVYGPIGSLFAATHTAALRQFIRRVVDRVFQPMVRVEAPPAVEIALRRKGGKLFLHLLNATQMQVAGDYVAGDFVPSVGPLRISIRLPQKPRQVTLEPGELPLPGEYRSGVWTGTVERLDIHRILAFAS